MSTHDMDFSPSYPTKVARLEAQKDLAFERIRALEQNAEEHKKKTAGLAAQVAELEQRAGIKPLDPADTIPLWQALAELSEQRDDWPMSITEGELTAIERAARAILKKCRQAKG